MKVNEFRLKLYPQDYYSNHRFFREVLGFKINHEWDHDDSKGVMFDVGGTILEFMWPVEDDLKNMASGSGLSLSVDDVNALYKNLKDKVEITHAIRQNSWGDISFGIATPENYKISFFTKIKGYED